MERFALVAAAGAAAVVPATAAAADTTPAGPATVLSEWLGASTMEGFAPQVLVAADITVGRRRPSGQHPVRAAYAGANAVGEEVHLPAAPGTYRFPAPHIPWDYR